MNAKGLLVMFTILALILKVELISWMVILGWGAKAVMWLFCEIAENGNY